MHRAVASHDIEALREAIGGMYDPADTPLVDTVKQPASYAPLFEVAVLARVFYGEDDPIDHEMRLNLKHTHRAFGVGDDECERICSRIDAVGEAADPVLAASTEDWGAGTCLRGLIKPLRHVDLFRAHLPRAAVA